MSIQWPLVIFTLFVDLGAGTLAILGLFGLLGKDKEIRIPALITSIAAIAIGGIAVTFHLQHFERIFNGFGNLTSGITWELIFIVLTAIVVVLYFVLARKGDTPKWIAAVALVIGIALAVCASVSYLMASHPAWYTAWLIIYYVCNAFVLGALAILAIAGFAGVDVKLAGILAIVAGALQTVATILYGFFFNSLGGSFTDVGNYFDPTIPTEGMIDASAIFDNFTGDNALLFWVLAVLLGAVVALVAGLIALKKQGKPVAGIAIVALLCAIAGGIAFRALLYIAGYWVYIIF